MTEQEWLECENPWNLLNEVGWNVSERKLRLFGVDCCRSLWSLAGDDLTKKAIEIAERFADGKATEDEASAAGEFMVEPERSVDFADHLSKNQANLLYSAGRMCVPFELIDNVQGVMNNLSWRDKENAALLRDVLGNPFRQLPPKRQKRKWKQELNGWLLWSDGAVKGLAHSIYDDRAFNRMPILADALEEAGCTDGPILSHCRGLGPHVRGCWVVDLLLGKE